MKYNYSAAIDELKMYQNLMHESGKPILNKNCFDVIEHALAMMQKLQEPSDDMLRDLTRGFRDFFSEKCPYPPARKAIKAMLEQAEKEIEGCDG